MGFLILFTPATRFPQPSSSRRLRRHPDNIRGRLRRNRKPLHGVRRPHQLAVMPENHLRTIARFQRHRAQNGGAPSPPLRPPSTPPPPAKLPSKKWRDLILQVWHTDPLICPKCQHQMRVIAVIDQRQVVEKILHHLGQWNGTPILAPARAPPEANAGPWTREPCEDVDPMPDYENVLTD